MTWLADNFSAIHLLLACCAMLYAKRCSPQWKVSAAYVAIYCAAYMILVTGLDNGGQSGPEFYLYCIWIELPLVGAYLMWRHPMSQWVAITALANIVFHSAAYGAYQQIPIIHPILTFLWSVHSVTIPIIELSQIAGIVVFALPMFRGLDAKPTERQITWQAKTSAPHFR